MKRYLLYIMILAGAYQYADANVGEIFINWKNSPGINISVSIEKQDYAWTWDNNAVVLQDSYSKLYYYLPLEFATPNTNSQEPEGIMPWGLMQYQISVNYGHAEPWSLNFQIDSRDQDWSGNYPNSDFYIDIDNGNKKIFLRNSTTSVEITGNQTINVWQFWPDHDPSRNNFKIPLVVKNTIGSSNPGGYLHVDGAQYSSGGSASVGYFTSHTVKTDNERFTDGATNKHNHWNVALNEYLFTHSYTPISGTNEDDAIFSSLSAATLYNSLDGTVVTESSGGYVPFVDPRYSDVNGNQAVPPVPVNVTSGHSPTGAYGQSSGGVFLGESGPPSWNSPVYSLQAPVSQTINNHTAYFGGWSSSPSGYVAFQDATSPTTAIEFITGGANVTANYIYSVVASNATLQAGTYTLGGPLTINSGATLTLTSGTTLQFPSGASLIVNGALSANGVTFTQSTSNGWSGITLNHDGSSITNCTISYASSPISLSGVNTATIYNCVINNSTFSSSQAISVSNSTPTITSVQINGQSGSSNGVRYTNGRGGTFTESTIHNLSAGNGIVVQGNSSPSISGCEIDSNYFYGIIITSDGSGTPSITGNNFYGNGTHNGTRQYFNIYFTASAGTVWSNYMTGSSAGVGAYSASTPNAGIAQRGSNTITGNDYGLLCSGSGSAMGFGILSGRDVYSSTCNNIYGNSYDDAYAIGGGTIQAEYNWWGVSPPNASKIYIGSGSAIDYTNWLTSQDGCPEGDKDLIVQGSSSLTASIDTSGTTLEVYGRATRALFTKDYATSATLCRSILRRSASVVEKEQALARLFTVFLQSGDTTIVSDLKSFVVGSDSLSQAAEEFLANAYAATGNTLKAASLADDLIGKNAGTETEKRALLILASLRAFDKNAESISASALRNVKARFGSSLDQGLIAALTTTGDVSASNFSSNKQAPQKNRAEAMVDNARAAVTEYGIENFPNPFNPTTTIAYQLPKDGRVTIKIFDALGREVKTLVDEYKSTGRYSLTFDGSNLASGIYFYSMRSGEFNAIKKMMLIK